MDYSVVVWLAGIGARTEMQEISARQTYSGKTGPCGTSWLIYEAEGKRMDGRKTATVTLWREMPRGWDVIETDHN